MGEDIFYKLKNNSVKNVKEVLKWAKENSKLVRVHMLDCSKSYGRVKADKTFDEVFDLIDKRSAKFFVIILRKDENVFGLFSDKLKIMDYLEIGIRSIDIDRKEYFIFNFLDKNKLEKLKERFEIKER